MANSSAMPTFKKPPVSEVALSIEFLPLENWNPSYAFLFGTNLRTEYPKMELQPPLFSEIEKFGDEFWQQNTMRVEMVNQNSQRFWFTSESSNWLIQVQQDRFILNWKKVTGDEEYPRYEQSIRIRFLTELDRFFKFVEDNAIGTIKATQCEVTYVNDIPHGEYWDSIAEAAKLFTILSSNDSAKLLGEMETIAVTGSYLIPDDKGRLRFSINHALRSIDKKEVLKMSLTARGRPSSPDKDSIINWIDMGREWVVKGFEDLTTKKAHEMWEKIE